MFGSTIKLLGVGVGRNGEVIKNVSGSPYLGDVSFVATLGAILHDRIPSEDTVTFETVLIEQRGSALESLLAQVPEIGKPKYYSVCSFNGDGNFAKNCWPEFEWIFCETHPGYEVLEKVTKFYEKSFGVRAFINRKTKSVVIFMDKLELQRFHYVQVSAVACMPWYFEPGIDIPEEVRSILLSFNRKDPADYISAIKTVVDKIKTKPHEDKE